MRFALLDSYFDFFLKHQILQLEGLLSEEETKALSIQIETLLIKHLHQKPLDVASNIEIWKAGKDLWKESSEIKKILFRMQLGEITHFLFKKRPIRLAYSQVVFTGNKQDSLFSSPKTLEEISSIDPIFGGALLCLENSLESEEIETSNIPQLKRLKKGNVLFFSGKHPIPFPELFAQKGLKALLLCFAAGNIRYKLEPQDPHTHELKKTGHAFGDLIEEEICPYLYR